MRGWREGQVKGKEGGEVMGTESDWEGRRDGDGEEEV